LIEPVKSTGRPGTLWDVIARLTAHACEQQCRPTIHELFDAVWLGAKDVFVAEEYVEPPPPEPPPPQPPPSLPLPVPKPTPPNPPPVPRPPLSPDPSSPPVKRFPLVGETHEKDSRRAGRGVAILIPGGRALPGALALSRALRPLKRRVPSRTEWIFDENLTVERVATERLPLLEMRPARTRWLEIAILIDRSPSMQVWQHTLREFQILLEREGAFRDVRVWHLEVVRGGVAAPGGKPEVIVRAPNQRQIRSPWELIDQAGRRVVLVATDCLGPEWDEGIYPDFIDKLGERMPVALLQLLPENLWPQTAMEATRSDQIMASEPGLPNRRLWSACAAGPVAKNHRRPVPVITLEPGFVACWARVVAGFPGAVAPAVAFDAARVPPAAPAGGTPANGASPVNQADISAEDRVAYFQDTSTATALELAGLLAAAPLTLPIMRLVQQTLLPQSRQSHLAEVFLGGLLRRLSPVTADENPDRVRFEFHTGVRKILLDQGYIPDHVEVLKAISGYMQQYLGSRLDIRAILADPSADGPAYAEGAEEDSFAEVSAEILERLGGRYAALARGLRPRPKGSATLTRATVVDDPFVGVRILWVDDRPSNNTHFSRELTNRGAIILNVTSTLDALAALNREPFTAIISDMGRPEGQQAGIDLLDRVRQKGFTMPIAIFAGMQGPKFAAQVRAHLGQVSTNDFSEVVSALEDALRTPATSLGHLPTDGVAALGEYLRQNKLNDELATQLDAEPGDSSRWKVIWEGLSEVQTAVRLLDVARCATQCADLKLYRPGSRGSTQYWTGTVADGEKERKPATAAVSEALRERRTVYRHDRRGSELTIPVPAPDREGLPLAILYISSLLPLAFGPRQIQWLEALARSASLQLGRDRIASVRPPRIIFTDNRGTDPEDRNKGRFGGKAAVGGRKLIAEMDRRNPQRNFYVDFIVRSTDGSPLQGPVYFHLHETYPHSPILITKMEAEGTQARLAEVHAAGTYTVGVQVKDAQLEWITLELDLAEQLHPPFFAALLFQSTPRLWSLAERLHAGEVIPWKVTRYKGHLQRGGLVLFWSSEALGRDDARGLWGWGIITGDSPKLTRGVERLPVTCVERWSVKDQPLAAPVPARTVFALSSWQQHVLGRFAAGTNFVVDLPQLKETAEVIGRLSKTSQLGRAVKAIERGELLDPRKFKPATLEWQRASLA